MSMSTINIGIIGLGTVGTGTVELLDRNAEIIAARVGTPVRVRRIADIDLERDRGIPIPRNLMTAEAMDIIEDPEIPIVVELMGGMRLAKHYILTAMEQGKHVVTANKALLAEMGPELYQTAAKNGVSLCFEASVCGGIPIISAMREGLAANRIQAIAGILNGTSNYILTRMTDEGLPYDAAVEEAVKRGFAEDPPTLDVDGTDAAHKLAILMSIAYGSPLAFPDIYREGIDQLSPEDIRFASEFGYRLKLLAIGRDLGDQIEARVHPAMIPQGHILANVNEAYNAVYVEGDFVGPNLYYGLGAGDRPTGSAVVSDIIRLARRLRMGLKSLMPPLAHAQPLKSPVRIQPMTDLASEYYFRFSAVDSPGVLSKISGVLGRHDISLSSVIQKGRGINGSVPIVMLTHEAREDNVRKALAHLDTLDALTDKTRMIRVESE